jgi:hypothetical protein
MARYAQAKRDARRRVRACINGEHHDKPLEGVRCVWCAEVHRRGIDALIADPHAPLPPPGYIGPRSNLTLRVMRARRMSFYGARALLLGSTGWARIAKDLEPQS